MIEAACPLPAAVTGGSIGPHARRNYGEGKSRPPAGDFEPPVPPGVLEAPAFQDISRGREAAVRGTLQDQAASKIVGSPD